MLLLNIRCFLHCSPFNVLPLIVCTLLIFASCSLFCLQIFRPLLFNFLNFLFKIISPIFYIYFIYFRLNSHQLQ